MLHRGSLTTQDICGSCFAVTCYQALHSWSGNKALREVRSQLNACGLRLTLDFVPTHTALDYP